MIAARRVLIGAGVVGLVVGCWLLVTTNRPSGLLGLVIWFAVAVLLHDALLSPLLFGVAWLLRLGTGRLPLAAVAVVQVAAVVGGIGSLLLLPAIHAKTLGVRNPTVLPLDYTAHLVGMWVVLAVLTAAALVVVLVRHRRRSTGGQSDPAGAPALETRSASR